MPVQGNDNLAVLLEPDVEDLVKELQDRFRRNIFYVNFGDGVIALNPQSGNRSQENTSENGRRYCSKKPISNLPAHIFGLAHAVYRDVRAPVSFPKAHSILISGFPGSGKTEISEMLISQFLREAGVSYTSNIPFLLMKGLYSLKRLVTTTSASGPTSSTASTVVTLYFGQDGRLKTAKIKLHLLNPRHVVPHASERGYLNIFYDIAAALQSQAPGVPFIERIQLILQSVDSALTQMNQQTFVDHRNNWLDVVEIIRDLNIGEDVSLGGNDIANTFLNSWLGLLLLVTVQFDMNQQTIHIRSKHSFAAAAELLGISDLALYNALISGTSNHEGMPALSPSECRDQLVFDIYCRLITWFIQEINSRLPEVSINADLQNEKKTVLVLVQQEEEDIPVHIADLQSFVYSSAGTLEDLCHNMAAEHLQTLLNEAVFTQESDACKSQGLKVTERKRHKCEDIVDLAFTLPEGLLHQLETACNNVTITDEALMKSLDRNFKKRKDLYLSSKSGRSKTFTIFHSHKQVEYHLNPLFWRQNLIVPNQEVHRLLASSRNITVQNVIRPAVMEFSGPNVKRWFSYVNYVRIQLRSLTLQVNGTIPHLVRCVRLSPVGPKVDVDLLKCQIQSAYLPEVTHHKKFHYSHWIAVQDFLARYKMLDLSLLSSSYSHEEACKTLLKKIGILGKGPAVTKNCVFLGYWHKDKLDTLVEEFVWKVTLAQACVRGYLTRKRLHEVVAARLRYHDEVASFRRGEYSSRRSDGQRQYSYAEEDKLLENITMKTLNRIDDLMSGVWAKVIFMEQGKEIVKVYASELSLLVTGSSEPFDGLELGLSYFHTPTRLEETEYIIENLHQGLELRRDSDGSLLAKRNCQLPVSVRSHASQPVLSADMLRTRGELPLDHFVKIFDMQEFYSLISLEMRKPTFSNASLQKSCITVLSLGGSDLHILHLPCWIAVVNMNALNVLNDEEELRSISLLTSQLTLEKEKEVKEGQDEAKLRRQRKHWSRIDQRPLLKKREANSRKLREELRNRGEKITDYMKYSWEEGVVHKAAINMDKLYEQMRKQSTASSSQSSGQSTPIRNWAKINVELRSATRELQKAEFEATNIIEHGSL